MMAGVSKLSKSYKYLTMFVKCLILAVSVSTYVVAANGIDGDNYADESTDTSLQIRPSKQTFNFQNLQRLRDRFMKEVSRSRNDDDYKSPAWGGAGIFTNDFSGTQQDIRDYNSDTENQLKFGEMEFYDELESSLPYGIQNVRRDIPIRPTRNHIRPHKPKTIFQSLCPSRRVVIPLETVSLEYRPDHYEEVTCFHSYAPSRNYMSENNKVCSEAGFTCIQLNRTVYLTRRAKGDDCWESETRIVPSGCECMWPKHTFGDITTYH